MNKSTFIKGANKIFKEHPSNIEQEICTTVELLFQRQVKEICVWQNSCKSFKFTNLNALFCFLYILL